MRMSLTAHEIFVNQIPFCSKAKKVQLEFVQEQLEIQWEYHELRHNTKNYQTIATPTKRKLEFKSTYLAKGFIGC